MEYTQLNLEHLEVLKLKCAEDLRKEKKINIFSLYKTGIYEMANVYLDGNNLTRFEANVFQDTLTQMADLGDMNDGGFISVLGSIVNTNL